MSPQPKASGRGCLFWGGIVVGVIFLCFLLAGIAGYCFVRHLVNTYTDTKPLTVAVTRLSDTQIKALRDRIRNFDRALTNGTPVQPLILTADEINALIAGQTTNSNAAHLYFSFEKNLVRAQLSLSLDEFGIWLLRGRYLNGGGDFAVSLHESQLQLNIKSLSVKGQPFPDQFMQSIRSQNLAEGYTNDVNFNNALKYFQEIKIEGGKLFVIPKAQKPVTAPKLEAGK